MRENGTLVGIRRGPISAIGPQPRGHRTAEIRAGVPTRPWGSRKLPRRLLAGDPRRTLFRSLLRRAEGVPVDFADGETGTVEEVVFSVLGFDFWPQALLVRLPDDGSRAAGRVRRVPVGRIRRIDVREPRIVVGPLSPERLEPDRAHGEARSRDDRRLQSLRPRRDLVSGAQPRRHRKAPVGGR